MPPQDPITPPPAPKPPTMHNPLAVMQPGEQTLFELKRHPIGILMMYVMTGLLLLALAVIFLVVAPGLTVSGGSQIKTLGTAVLLLFVILGLVFNLVATVVYWGNRWILTDDSITQITQTSLFHKETSSLGLESLEDVTATKSGILPYIFNYGTLTAETAGHHGKFVFPFAPNPTKYAQQILEAREKEQIENNQQRYAYPPHDPGPPAPPPEQPTPPAYS